MYTVTVSTVSPSRIPSHPITPIDSLTRRRTGLCYPVADTGPGARAGVMALPLLLERPVLWVRKDFNRHAALTSYEAVV